MQENFYGGLKVRRPEDSPLARYLYRTFTFTSTSTADAVSGAGCCGDGDCDGKAGAACTCDGHEARAGLPVVRDEVLFVPAVTSPNTYTASVSRDSQTESMTKTDTETDTDTGFNLKLKLKSSPLGHPMCAFVDIYLYLHIKVSV